MDLLLADTQIFRAQQVNVFVPLKYSEVSEFSVELRALQEYYFDDSQTWSRERPFQSTNGRCGRS